MEVVTTLLNYSIIGIFQTIFSEFSNDYILENGIFYSKTPPLCPECLIQMVHNGYNLHSKKT